MQNLMLNLETLEVETFSLDDGQSFRAEDAEYVAGDSGTLPVCDTCCC